MSADATLFAILAGFLVVIGGGSALVFWTMGRRIDRDVAHSQDHRRR